MNKFHLMHKNDIVANLTIKNDIQGKGYLHVIEVLNKEILPIGTRNTQIDLDQQITGWNDSRCIPLGRPRYSDILEKFKVSTNSELLPYCYMCSLTDCYWFKPENSTVTWEDVNFHQNRFSSNLYKHLFYGELDEPINHLNSADITTDGALPKMWQDVNNSFVLIKGKLNGNPIDACYEIIADAIFNDLQIEHVSYELIEIDGQIYSACECFICSDQEEFVPIDNLMSDYGYTYQTEIIPRLIEMGFKNEIDKMMLGDAILGNLDRHARNYGVIIDSDTQETKRFAPLFDHNICCLLNNHGFLIYQPTRETFNKTIPKINSDVLSLAENIDLNTVRSIVNSLPLDDNLKIRMINQLESRIEKIIELSRGQEHDFDRKQ